MSSRRKRRSGAAASSRPTLAIGAGVAIFTNERVARGDRSVVGRARSVRIDARGLASGHHRRRNGAGHATTVGDRRRAANRSALPCNREGRLDRLRVVLVLRRTRRRRVPSLAIARTQLRARVEVVRVVDVAVEPEVGERPRLRVARQASKKSSFRHSAMPCVGTLARFVGVMNDASRGSKAYVGRPGTSDAPKRVEDACVELQRRRHLEQDRTESFARAPGTPSTNSETSLGDVDEPSSSA